MLSPRARFFCGDVEGEGFPSGKIRRRRGTVQFQKDDPSTQRGPFVSVDKGMIRTEIEPIRCRDFNEIGENRSATESRPRLRRIREDPATAIQACQRTAGSTLHESSERYRRKGDSNRSAPSFRKFRQGFRIIVHRRRDGHVDFFLPGRWTDRRDRDRHTGMNLHIDLVTHLETSELEQGVVEDQPA